MRKIEPYTEGFNIFVHDPYTYVCCIVHVTDFPEREALEIQYYISKSGFLKVLSQISEGDVKNSLKKVFEDGYEDFGNYMFALMDLSYKDTNHFSDFIEMLEASNDTFCFDGETERDLIGNVVGRLLLGIASSNKNSREYLFEKMFLRKIANEVYRDYVTNSEWAKSLNT